MWKVGSGIKEIDDTIGGYQSGTLILFFGRTGVGKTTLTGYIPITQIYKFMMKKYKEKLPEKLKFVFMDCDGGFDFERAYQIWEANGLDPDDVKSHMIYSQPTTFDEQHTYIKKLEKLLADNKWEPILITCDAMCAIYRGIILRTAMKVRASVIGSYTGKLDLQLTYMRKLGVIYECPIVVTTWTSSPVGLAMGSEGEVPFIGGRQFGFLPKTIIEVLAESFDNPNRMIKLYKSRSTPAGKTAQCQLCDEGIKTIKKKEK